MAWVRQLARVSVIGVVLNTALGGCGTDAVGTDACRKIEQARCRQAPSCPALGIQGDVSVQECVQFARDRCLHGLAVVDPGPTVVDACVNAISSTANCDVVTAPETTPACAFLSPSPPAEAGTTDAGADASDPTSDAETDGAEGGQEGG